MNESYRIQIERRLDPAQSRHTGKKLTKALSHLKRGDIEMIKKWKKKKKSPIKRLLLRDDLRSY